MALLETNKKTRLEPNGIRVHMCVCMSRGVAARVTTDVEGVHAVVEARSKTVVQLPNK